MSRTQSGTATSSFPESYYNEQSQSPSQSSFSATRSQPADPPPAYEQTPKKAAVARQEPNDGKLIRQSGEPRWRDVAFLVLFLLNVGGFFAVFGVKLHGSIVDGGASGPDQVLDVDVNLLPVWLACMALGLVWSFIWLMITKAFTRVIIVMCMVLTVLIMVGIGVVLCIFVSLWGILLILVGLVFAFLFYTWRSRIPFSTVMLEAVLRVTFSFPATIGIAVLFLFIQVGYLIAWIIAVTGVAAAYSSDPNNPYNIGSAFLIIYLIFCVYWTTQVLQTIVHVTSCGTMATWYFYGTGATPPNPTIHSLKRATTTSLGSICFGSLIVAILQTIRTILRMMRYQRGGCCTFCLLCVDCLLGCIESLIQYFNLFAFTQVAIYGKSYCEAAKSTWELIKTHGIDAIINDCLISNVLSFANIVGGLLGAVLAGVWMYYTNPQTGTYVLAAIIGYVITSSLTGVIMSVIRSGEMTIFVAWAEEPDVLARTDPALHQQLEEALFGRMNNNNNPTRPRRRNQGPY